MKGMVMLNVSTLNSCWHLKTGSGGNHGWIPGSVGREYKTAAGDGYSPCPYSFSNHNFVGF